MATLARQKHTGLERSIAKQLGLTDAQLDALLRIKAGYWPGNAAACLEAKGLAFRAYERRETSPGYHQQVCVDSGLTAAGHDTLARARSMGF
jgi:hypothetical protein